VLKLANAPTLLAALLLLASCSRQKTIDRDELRSELTAAISIASEAESFIDYVAQHRATGNYAKGHIQYLAEEAARTAKELGQGSPDASTAKHLPEGRKELDSLAHELATVHTAVEYSETLDDSRQKISNVRTALEQVKAGL
jgi:hypothetical protein